MSKMQAYICAAMQSFLRTAVSLSISIDIERRTFEQNLTKTRELK